MLKILKNYLIAMGVYFIPSLLIIICCNMKTNFEIITPGGVTKIEDRFLVENGFDSGELYSLSVYSKQNSTLFQNFVSNFFDLATKSEMSETYSHMTNEMWYEAGVIQKEQSEEASIINAYKYASLIDSNISINYSYVGAIVRITTSNTTIIKLGDIITHKNDIAITSKDDLIFTDENGKSYLNIKNNDKLTILRDGKTIEVTKTENDTIGTAFYDKFNIYDNDGKVNATPKINIYPTNNIGPSAGMMQTLSIYNQLLNDNVVGDKKIAGTGTIETDGTIGAIGGVAQKVYTAYTCNASIMIVSSDNYNEAKEMYDKLGIKENEMKLISVSNFNEVITCLM